MQDKTLVYMIKLYMDKWLLQAAFDFDFVMFDILA